MCIVEFVVVATVNISSSSREQRSRSLSLLTLKEGRNSDQCVVTRLDGIVRLTRTTNATSPSGESRREGCVASGLRHIEALAGSL